MKHDILAVGVALIFTIADTHAQSVASTPAVALSQQKAVDKYPDLGVKGSALNIAFVDVFNHWKVWKPQALQRDDWPEVVAEQAVAALRARQAEEARRKTQVIQIQK